MIEKIEESKQVFWFKNNTVLSGDLHIHIIIDNPSIFDLSMDYINKIYELENEPLGSEGKARQSIIKKVMKNNWIRVRYRPEQNTWYIEVYNYETQKYNIKECIEYILKTGIIKPDIKIFDKNQLVMDKQCYSTIEDILK